MSTQREVFIKALEALEIAKYLLAEYDEMTDAITALRAALAEQKCPCGDRPAEQCLGEWEPGCDMGSNPKYAKVAEHTPQQKAQEPVAWAYQWKQGNPISWYVTVARWPESDIWHEYPLYTAPQQAEPVHDWKAEYIKLEKLYNEARMELYDEQMLHRKTLYELEEALDKLAEMDVALERMRQKTKRTVTYVCPVCAASLEKQE